MGFSLVFAAAILGILIIFSLSIATAGIVELSYQTSMEEAKLWKLEKLRRDTAIKIVGVEASISDGTCTQLNIEVLNSGEPSIRISEAPHIDLILKYVSKQDGNLLSLIHI